jgi:hypothetical protein
VAGHAARFVDNKKPVHSNHFSRTGLWLADVLDGCRTSDRNSARVSFCRKQPTMALVTVDEFCFSMPRIIMHKVPRLDHHAHALRLNGLLNGVGDLAGEPLLHLQTPRKHFN